MRVMCIEAECYRPSVSGSTVRMRWASAALILDDLNVTERRRARSTVESDPTMSLTMISCDRLTFEHAHGRKTGNSNLKVMVSLYECSYNCDRVACVRLGTGPKDGGGLCLDGQKDADLTLLPGVQFFRAFAHPKVPRRMYNGL